MKDFLGRDITEGAEVAYCTRSGSNMNMIHAKVLVAGDGVIQVETINCHDNYRTRLSHAEYIVLL